MRSLKSRREGNSRHLSAVDPIGPLPPHFELQPFSTALFPNFIDIATDLNSTQSRRALLKLPQETRRQYEDSNAIFKGLHDFSIRGPPLPRRLFVPAFCTPFRCRRSQSAGPNTRRHQPYHAETNPGGVKGRNCRVEDVCRPPSTSDSGQKCEPSWDGPLKFWSLSGGWAQVFPMNGHEENAG